MLPRPRRFVTPFLVLAVFAPLLAFIVSLLYSFELVSASLTRHNILRGTAGDIAARVQTPLANHRTSLTLTIKFDPLSQVPTIVLADAKNEHDGLGNLNVGNVPTVVAASQQSNLPQHPRPPLIINTLPLTAHTNNYDLCSRPHSHLHLPSFFLGILFAVFSAIWILRGIWISILFKTGRCPLRQHLPPQLLRSFNGSILCDSLIITALNVKQVASALHVQAGSLLQRSRVRFLTDAPSDIESQCRPTYANAGVQTDDTDDTDDSVYGDQSQYGSQSEYQDEASRSQASDSQDDNAPYNPFNTSHYLAAADGIGDPYAPHLSLPFSPFIVPQFDTNAYLRRQLTELRLDDKPHDAVDSINASRSVIKVNEGLASSPSLGEGIKQVDRQDKIQESPVHRPTRLFSTFVKDEDPVYFPGPIVHGTLSLPSTGQDVRQGRARWEVLSPGSSPYTSSEEGTPGQSEGSVTSDDEELPEDLAWIFNYKDAPILWATQSFDSLYVSDLQASVNEVVGMNIEDMEEIPDLAGSVGYDNGVQYAGDISDEMLDSQVVGDFQAQDDSDIAQSEALQYSTFV